MRLHVPLSHALVAGFVVGLVSGGLGIISDALLFSNQLGSTIGPEIAFGGSLVIGLLAGGLFYGMSRWTAHPRTGFALAAFCAAGIAWLSTAWLSPDQLRIVVFHSLLIAVLAAVLLPWLAHGGGIFIARSPGSSTGAA